MASISAFHLQRPVHVHLFPIPPLPHRVIHQSYHQHFSVRFVPYSLHYLSQLSIVYNDESMWSGRQRGRRRNEVFSFIFTSSYVGRRAQDSGWYAPSVSLTSSHRSHPEAPATRFVRSRSRSHR